MPRTSPVFSQVAGRKQKNGRVQTRETARVSVDAPLDDSTRRFLELIAEVVVREAVTDATSNPPKRRVPGGR